MRWRRQRLETVWVELPRRIIHWFPFYLRCGRGSIACERNQNRSRKYQWTQRSLTESWRKNVSSLTDQWTFPSNTDCCQWIITSNHSACQMSSSKLLDDRSCPRFESILKDDQAKKAQSRFCLFTGDKWDSAYYSQELSCTDRFIRWAFNQDKPSMLFPAIAITRYPRLV